VVKRGRHPGEDVVDTGGVNRRSTQHLACHGDADEMRRYEISPQTAPDRSPVQEPAEQLACGELARCDFIIGADGGLLGAHMRRGERARRPRSAGGPAPPGSPTCSRSAPHRRGR